MTLPLSRSIERTVLQRLAAAQHLFCFLDYDGTLSPLAPTPDEAVPLPSISTLLRQLAAVSGVQVAVVTGRPIAGVRRLLDVSGIYYIGIHGVEVRLPSGEYQVAEGIESACAVLPEIKDRLHHLLGARPGILLEDKGAALACHYRLATPTDAAVARHAIAVLGHDYQRRGVPISLVYGHEVAEIRPAHLNKGRAAIALLAAHGQTALPVYVGDDQTDEDAFELLPPESITIRVATPGTPTRARYLMRGPLDVQRFLRALLESRLAALPTGKSAEQPDIRSR